MKKNVFPNRRAASLQDNFPRKSLSRVISHYVSVFFSVVFVILLFVGVWIGYQHYVSKIKVMPLKHIYMQKPLRYGQLDELKQIVLNQKFAEDLLLLDSKELSLELAAVPWVRTVKVHKIWPDALMLDVEERMPVYRWDNTQYIDIEGKRFSYPEHKEFKDLFLVHGLDGREKKLVDYTNIILPWLRKQGVVVDTIFLDKNDFWHIVSNGIDIKLGREYLHERLKRLAVINKILIKPYGKYINSIDLRYESHNIFSVQFKKNAKLKIAEFKR